MYKVTKQKLSHWNWMGLLLIPVLSLLVLSASCSKEKSPAEGVQYYTCGMHPSVKVTPQEYADGNDLCPICNMKLTPVMVETNSAISHSNNEGDSNIEYYTCGMHPSVKVTPLEFANGNDLCPICNMKLVPVQKEENVDLAESQTPVLKIPHGQVQLAGITSITAEKRHLYKNIRTVGKVAYDPELVVAQEELIAGLKALEKMDEGGLTEIKESSDKLLESSRRKLRLLGLTQSQIIGLEKSREVQRGLIMPEKKMWVYGSVYEHEISWVMVGQKVIVTAPGIPGVTFQGYISSFDPVLDPQTRALTFRAEINNPGLKLMPEMYVDIEIESVYQGENNENMVLSIPVEAVLETGLRKMVWIEVENGKYENREVSLGPVAMTKIGESVRKYYPVLSGIEEDEKVVTRGNFLIDSQSQITGVAASSYGGALGVEESPTQAHSH